MVFAPSNLERELKFKTWMYKRPVNISKSIVKCQMPSQEPPASSKAPNQDLKDMDVHCTLKPGRRAKIWNIGGPKTSDHIQIKIKMRNPCQEP